MKYRNTEQRIQLLDEQLSKYVAFLCHSLVQLQQYSAKWRSIQRTWNTKSNKRE